MGKEIERKFLVISEKFSPPDSGTRIKQGYIATQDLTVVRVRVAGDKAFLTLKGANKGLVRTEFEYEITQEDAEAMLRELCSGPIIDKTRYHVRHDDKVWEVDIFHGDNEGLVIAEIELDSEAEGFDHPEWLGEDVSYDVRYFNSNLLDKPYKDW